MTNKSVEAHRACRQAHVEDPFTLEANGQPILLAPGRTWFELADAQHNLTDG